ncbi:MAG TPA: redoxin domain-containing protein [Candidatus Dormibacteraeota bacterium]|jgi:peroxiredoxin|nr:redoxin domain-containing protein [Candidatus Dormibacteraeota bacterium]
MEAPGISARRLRELQERFAELEPTIPDGPEKAALSALHGMVQEMLRILRDTTAGGDGRTAAASGPTLEEIALLYRKAPPMEGEAESTPLPPGTPAPDFRLRDGDGNTVSLADFRGRKLLVVVYPLDWSPACSDQLSLYQNELDEFARRGLDVVAISVDSIYSHGAWAAVRGITFPLLADFHPKGEVAQRYSAWRNRDGFSERALFVLDGEGVIRHSLVSPRINEVPDIYDLYRVLDEVAPAPAAALTGSRT